MTRYRCTPSERLFVALNELGDGEGMITSGIRIRGLVDDNRIRDALARLQARHAKLRCRTEYDARKWPWFVEMDPVVPVQCEFRDVADPTESQDVLLHAWPGRFPLDTSGPLQIIVLKCAATNSTDIIGWFHHAVFDGPAVWLFFEEFLQAYADPQSCRAPAPGGFEVRPKVSNSGWGDLVWLAQAIWRRAILGRLRPAVTFRNRRIGDVTYARTVLDADFSRQLLKACRLEEASVTAAISAAACQVITEEASWHGRVIYIPTPRDARANFDPPVEKGTIGCFATLYDLGINLPERDTDFWDYARMHTTEAKRQSEIKDPIRALRLVKHIPVKAIKKAERGALMVNNLGRVSTAGSPHLPELLDYYGYVRTKTLSGYCVTVTASTTNDRMAISLATACFDQTSIERLLEEIVGLLKEGVRTSGVPALKSEQRGVAAASREPLATA
jgi:hypothetical protein